MIEFSNVSYVYGKHTPFERAAVNDVSFRIEDETVTGIIGHTGSGKSTVAQMMNALLTPTSGRVTLDGVDINSSREMQHDVRFKVGIVFQYPEYQLFEETVEKDIAFGPSNMGLSESEIKERVEMASEFTGLTKSMLSVSPFELSGGQKRRAAIAGVIAMRPQTLVLDEPAAGLDPKGRNDILSRLLAYRRGEGNSLVIISHSMEDVSDYSDRILAMNDGKILCGGTPEEVFTHYDELRSSGLSVPQITEIMKLIGKEIPGIPQNIFTVDKAYEIISSYLKGGGGKC